MQTALRRKTETGNEKDPSAALGMTKRERNISHSFSIRYGSQPPPPTGHLLLEEGGRIAPHRLPMKKAYDTRMLLPPHRHFERTREIFFVRGEEKAVRMAGNGKHRAPNNWGDGASCRRLYEGKRKWGNEKDPSAALGMTKRERHISHCFSIRCGSQPPPPTGHLLPEEGERMAFSRIVIAFSWKGIKHLLFLCKMICESSIINHVWLRRRSE